MRPALLVPLLTCLSIPAVPQEVPVGTWRSYTSLQNVRDIERVDESIIAATAGGLFRFDVPSGSFTITTNSEGLTTNDLTAVGADVSGRLWAGGSGGEVHVIEPEGGSIRPIMDIAGSPRLQKAIRAFVSRGDTVFIVTEFGVSVFRTDRWEFGDTYANFSLPSPPAVRDVAVYRDSIWIATGSGLVVAWLGGQNLSAPASWTLAPSAGLPSTSVFDLEVLNDTLYAATSGGLAVNGGGGFAAVPAHAGRQLVRLTTDGAEMLLLETSASVARIYRSSHAADGGSLDAPVFAATGNDLAYDPMTDRHWLATSSQGLVEDKAGVWSPNNPDGPTIGKFYNVAVDQDGTLWAGSGFSGGGRGFVRFDPSASDGSRWKSFTSAVSPIMLSDDYYKVNPVGGGSVWVSSWGYGVVEVVGDSVVRRLDTQSTPSLASSVAGAPTFAVIGSVVPDEDGIAWIVNRTAVNGNVLAKLLPDGTMEYQRNLLPGGEGRFTSLVIDGEGTKWIANSEPTAKASTGLFYFNERLTVEGTSSTGGWGVLTQSDGLPNNTVMSLAVDNDGDVWAGTDLGVAIFTNPRTPRSRRFSSFPLREQSIQSIAVDAVNRKWVGTKEGVFVVSSDGSRLLEQFTVLNTNGALIDNDVRTIDIDQRRGIVYMGTEKGLSAFWIAAVATQRSFSTLTLAPNPFLIPSSGQLLIRNLVQNSAIKVLTVDGQLVSEFDAQGGGRAFWDGRDGSGAYVASGVYVIVAFTEDGEQVTRGKVVVVRR